MTHHTHHSTTSPYSLALFLVLLLMGVTLILTLFAVPAEAQESPPAPADDSEQLKKLKEENNILEQKLKKAENQKKLLETYFPGTQQELPKGSITLENSPYIETEILAYQVMSESALSFSKRLMTKLPAPYNQNQLFIYNEEQFASPFFYRAYLSQLDLLEQRYVSLPNMAPTPTPSPSISSGASPGAAAMLLPIIEGMLGSAADIASFFKTDAVIRGVTFDIDELAFISQIAKEPMQNDVKVSYPALLSPDLFNAASPLMDRVGKLYQLRVRAAAEIARLNSLKQPIDEEIADLQEQIEAMADGPEKQELIQKLNEKLKGSKAYADRIAPYKTMNQLFEDLVGGLLKPGDNAGITTLVKLLKAEKLQLALDDKSYILVFKLKTGGNVKTTSNIFRGSKQYHSGGSIATYALFDSKMHMIDAAMDPRYKGYVKVRSKTEAGSDLGTR
jgi:hypothetical protein